MRNRAKRIYAALLLILFAGYWGSVTLFPHAHHVDGFVIVHSHPFSGAANGSAPLNHTPQQFQLIAHLSLLVMVAAVALSFAARLLGVRYVFRMMRPVGCLRPASAPARCGRLPCAESTLHPQGLHIPPPTRSAEGRRFSHSVTRTQSDEKTFSRSALCAPPCRNVSRCGTRRPCR